MIARMQPIARRALLLFTFVSACAAGPSQAKHAWRGERRISTADLRLDFLKDPQGAAHRWGKQERSFRVGGPLLSRSALPGGPFDATVLVTFGNEGAEAACYTLASLGGNELFAWSMGRDVWMRTHGAAAHALVGAAGTSIALEGCELVLP